MIMGGAFGFRRQRPVLLDSIPGKRKNEPQRLKPNPVIKRCWGIKEF